MHSKDPLNSLNSCQNPKVTDEEHTTYVLACKVEEFQQQLLAEVILTYLSLFYYAPRHIGTNFYKISKISLNLHILGVGSIHDVHGGCHSPLGERGGFLPGEVSLFYFPYSLACFNIAL